MYESCCTCGPSAAHVCDFGNSLVPYGEGLNLQQRLAELCKERAIPDTLLLVQASAHGFMLAALPAVLVCCAV